MDYLTPALLLAVLGLVTYVAFFRKNPGATGSEASNTLLLDDVRQQLAAANATAERERNAKTDALSRVSGAESAKQSAVTHLADAEARHTRQAAELKASTDQTVAQLREDQRKALEAAEARYNQALVDLRITFEKTSTDVLKGMAPDVTKEVASKVEP